jgi:hypothetical protein
MWLHGTMELAFFLQLLCGVLHAEELITAMFLQIEKVRTRLNVSIIRSSQIGLLSSALLGSHSNRHSQ